MGRKKNKLLRQLKQESAYEKEVDAASDNGPSHLSVKQLAKRKKKHRKEYKKHSVTVTKDYPWYLVKVYDTTPPTKEFLRESFSSLMDTEFAMLGYHHSTTSSRFFIEKNSAAASAIGALNKRMQGSQGRIMEIQVEPCKSFLLLNAQQMVLVKQVLERRYNSSTCILDLNCLHHDPAFLEQNILAVLWDPSIFRQVLTVIRDNIPNLMGIILSHNALRLTCMRVMADTISNCALRWLNLEANELENVKELIAVLSKFPIEELKLEGNNCLKDIKNPVIYIKTVQAKLPHLKTLDGVVIAEYLKNNAAVPTACGSAVPLPAVEVSLSNDLIEKFLSQYYRCLDSEQRLQLVNAYTPNAEFAIQSDVPAIPAGKCVGHDSIREALKAMPATKHSNDTFSLKVVKMEPSEGQVEVSGQLQLIGCDEVVSFVHALKIVPYNSGLGCCMSVLFVR